jgi:exosortase
MLMPIRLPLKNLLALLLLISSFILAYFPVWKGLLSAWSASDDYSHGFFILPVSLYIVWQKRERLAQVEKRPSSVGGIIVIFSLALYLLAHYAEVVTLASLSLVFVLVGVIIYLFGFSVFRELLFPLLFLFFMIPVPSQIFSSLTVPLQLLVSKASTAIATLSGVPVLREGNVIFLPNRTLEVVQACSGLRSMMLLLALSAGFAYLTLRANTLRIALLAWAVPAAILVNVIRVLLIIFADAYFGYDLTVDTSHTVFGVFIFILALILITGARGVLSTWDRSAAQG